MDYIKKTYTDKAVEVQISSFAGKGGVTEYHVLLAITDQTLPFSGQLQNLPAGLCGSCPRGITQECDCRFPTLFPERHSQPGRFSDGLGMRKFLLPAFRCGTGSTEREQNSHVDLVPNRYHRRNDQKRNVEGQTQPLYTILDRRLLQQSFQLRIPDTTFAERLRVATDRTGMQVGKRLHPYLVLRPKCGCQLCRCRQGSQRGFSSRKT